jgi:hypothetical protein
VTLDQLHGRTKSPFGDRARSKKLEIETESETELENSERQSRLANLVRRALSNDPGTELEQLLEEELEPECLLAIEALFAAKHGTERRLVDQYISAPERMTLLNRALATLEPHLGVVASAEMDEARQGLFADINSCLSDSLGFFGGLASCGACFGIAHSTFGVIIRGQFLFA